MQNNSLIKILAAYFHSEKKSNATHIILFHLLIQQTFGSDVSSIFFAFNQISPSAVVTKTFGWNRNGVRVLEFKLNSKFFNKTAIPTLLCIKPKRKPTINQQ